MTAVLFLFLFFLVGLFNIKDRRWKKIEFVVCICSVEIYILKLFCSESGLCELWQLGVLLCLSIKATISTQKGWPAPFTRSGLSSPGGNKAQSSLRPALLLLSWGGVGRGSKGCHSLQHFRKTIWNLAGLLMQVPSSSFLRSLQSPSSPLQGKLNKWARKQRSSFQESRHCIS